MARFRPPKAKQKAPAVSLAAVPCLVLVAVVFLLLSLVFCASIRAT